VQGGQGADGVRVPVQPVQQLGRLDELGLGLVPAPGRGEDAAIVGAAEGGHHVASPQQVGGGAHPLVGPGDVVGQLAGPEQPAHDRVLGRHLAQLAGADGRQGLVEQDQALLSRQGPATAGP
jgi:hypothetical protein